MILTGYRPIKSKVLIIEAGLDQSDTSIGRSAQALVSEIEMRDLVVIPAFSYQDGMASIVSDASIHGVLLSWELEGGSPAGIRPAMALLEELRRHHDKVPVFLMAETSAATGEITEDAMVMVDEFVWMLEDTADFIAGRVVAAVDRYREQLLPPFASALARYSRLREHSWSAPGHQGGIAFTKLPVGRVFFDFYGENLFRTDMGIERGQLGSLPPVSSAPTGPTVWSAAPPSPTAPFCRPV